MCVCVRKTEGRKTERRMRWKGKHRPKLDNVDISANEVQLWKEGEIEGREECKPFLSFTSSVTHSSHSPSFWLSA